MKDIDFDELDRAVSSVLNSADSKASSTPVTSSDALGISPTDGVAAADVSGDRSAIVSDDTNTKPVTVPSPALAVKRRGKFMDVMHPSHDMTSSTPSAPVVKRSPLLPISENVMPDTVVEPGAPDSFSPPDTITQESSAAGTAELGSSSFTDSQDVPSGDTSPAAYVDPIDFAAQYEREAIAEPEVSVSTGSIITSTESALLPASTPFIDDAQVEKRPLGAFGENEISTPIEAAENKDSGATSRYSSEVAVGGDVDGVDTEENNEAQVAPVVSLPRELQPDIVQVESVHDVAKSVEMSTEAHPLFDTSTYHEPVGVKTKKTPGKLLWVTVFLACLAIGVGVGYFIFMTGL